MKNKALAITLIIGLLSVFSPTAAEARDEDEVIVTIPGFPVTVNGVEWENDYSEYPLLVYKGITYFPMTYNGARFLHLKANWYDSEQNRVLYVGYCETAEEHWSDYSGTEKNKKSYQAVIPAYAVAVNTLNADEFIDNQKEEYPLLNFRGITYFPLTWRFAVTEFGWKYNFSADKGLEITSSEQFRPELDDEEYFTNSMPSRTLAVKDYVYNLAGNAYAGFPATNLGGAEFVYRQKGKPPVSIEAVKLFNDGEYYFNKELSEDGKKCPASAEPLLNDGILTINAVKMNDDGEINVNLRIDLLKGAVLKDDKA